MVGDAPPVIWLMPGQAARPDIGPFTSTRLPNGLYLNRNGDNCAIGFEPWRGATVTPPKNTVVFGYQAGTDIKSGHSGTVLSRPDHNGPFTWVRRGRGWIAYRTAKES